MKKKRKKRPEGRNMGPCPCGGTTRGVRQFGRWWTWCDRCTPVVTVPMSKVEGALGGKAK